MSSDEDLTNEQLEARKVKAAKAEFCAGVRVQLTTHDPGTATASLYMSTDANVALVREETYPEPKAGPILRLVCRLLGRLHPWREHGATPFGSIQTWFRAPVREGRRQHPYGLALWATLKQMRAGRGARR